MITSFSFWVLMVTIFDASGTAHPSYMMLNKGAWIVKSECQIAAAEHEKNLEATYNFRVEDETQLKTVKTTCVLRTLTADHGVK